MPSCVFIKKLEDLCSRESVANALFLKFAVSVDILPVYGRLGFPARELLQRALKA
jgi:hypothetical protein